MKRKFNIYCALLIGAIVLGMSIHTVQTASYFILGARAGLEASEIERQASRAERQGDRDERQGAPDNKVMKARDTKMILQLMNLAGVELLPKNPLLLQTGDSIVNTKTGEKMPMVAMTGMVIPKKGLFTVQRQKVLSSIGCLSFALVLVFWVLFIKLIIAVNKGRIFEESMEKQLAWGGWLVLGIYLLEWASAVVNYYYNTKEFAFDAYKHTIHDMPDNALLYAAFGMLLVGQIFKIGRQLKEEQELTI